MTAETSPIGRTSTMPPDMSAASGPLTAAEIRDRHNAQVRAEHARNAAATALADLLDDPIIPGVGLIEGRPVFDDEDDESADPATDQPSSVPAPAAVEPELLKTIAPPVMPSSPAVAIKGAPKPDHSPRYYEADSWIVEESPEDATVAQIVTKLRGTYDMTANEARELLAYWRDVHGMKPLGANEIDDAVREAFTPQHNAVGESTRAGNVGTSSGYPSKRAAALNHARSGFAVFPVIPNGKLPAIKSWQQLATMSADQIDKWWRANPNYNIGITTSDLLVVDVDPRHGGNAEMLMQTGDWPDTARSRTQGGGDHIIFRLPEHTTVRGGAGVLGQGVDIRSWGNLIVAPGSTIDGRAYRWGDNRPVALAPDWLIARCRAPRLKTASAGKRVVEEDNTAVELAWDYLNRLSPEATLGNLKDNAFKVGARLFDFGVSEDTATDMLRWWGDYRCHPRLEDDTIAHTVRSVSTYRGNAIGSAHPDAPGFEAVEIAPRTGEDDPQPGIPGVDDAPKPFISLATPFQFPDPSSISPVPWVIENLVARQLVSTLTGPGGVAKSRCALHIAAAVAAGRPDIVNFAIPKREVVWVWSQEDSIDQMNARVCAIMQDFNVTRADLEDEHGRSMLLLNSGLGRKKRLNLVKREGDVMKPGRDLSGVIETAIFEGAGLVIFDPLVSFHQATENINEQMRAVFDHVADIAADADCGILLICHTGKPDKASSKGWAGDPYATRGGSAQADAARVAMTFLSMSEDDAKKWRIPETDSHLDYVRIDEAKTNLGPKGREPHWFRHHLVALAGYRGGTLPVLRPVNLEKRAAAAKNDELADRLGEAIRDHLPCETWLAVLALFPYLPDRLVEQLKDSNNRGRMLNAAFDGANDIITDAGILRRTIGKGRKGTMLMLNPVNPSKPLKTELMDKQAPDSAAKTA